MTEEERKAYAKWLAEKERGLNVEYLSIFEMYDDYAHSLTGEWPDDTLADADGDAVDKLLREATFTVAWS